MKMLLLLSALLSAALLASTAPPTCYSRVLSLSKEITESFKELQTSKTDSCVETLPRLYLDIHNYCVLAKLRDFVAYPGCDRVVEVNKLKEKARSLYTILISYCRRDLVFLTDDCNALEIPISPPIEHSITES
ncbi:cytokine-like protein 1 isoform X2 [Corvus cornix cornix]|uniref:cytokine-like protein 1 isoform X2 n=1 Tax=Corvus cornix cornix TaxID=932674 RepID=UPI00053513A9|nr:cytokine-like protein 1 isoform X2 [Corvus cornix cornix]XP_017583116.1 PREDICTED: cytokine-like protein 1 isoform X2 [Corvus brachyrhynchos]XP_031966243.1 cytokine-like protein 1 isoform X2 [Corvus moneduloides]